MLTIDSIKLICFLLVFPFLRFKSDEERTPLYLIVEETFPSLLGIFSKLVQIVNPTIEVADLIKLICKIFWSSIYVCAFNMASWVFFHSPPLKFQHNLIIFFSFLLFKLWLYSWRFQNNFLIQISFIHGWFYS